jgi:hypothetical protein
MCLFIPLEMPGDFLPVWLISKWKEVVRFSIEDTNPDPRVWNWARTPSDRMQYSPYFFFRFFPSPTLPPPGPPFHDFVGRPEFEWVAGNFKAVTLNDQNAACGLKPDHSVVCTADLVKAKWTPYLPPTASPQRYTGPWASIHLKNDGELCGLSSTTRELHCRLDGHTIPAYPGGPLRSIALTSEGLCGTSPWKKLVCYYLSQKTWELYDAPNEIETVRVLNRKLCVIDSDHDVFCTNSMDPSHGSLGIRWHPVGMKLTSIALGATFLCGTSPEQHILCMAMGKPGNALYYHLKGALVTVEGNGQGTLCGVTQENTVYYRQGLPQALKSVEEIPRDTSLLVGIGV